MNIDVELRNVVKEFPARRGEEPVRAVDNVSLEIYDGEFFAMLGPSGCGKTTTLRMIAGFEAATSGEILLRGKPVQNVPPFHRPVNTVFQDYALFPHMTALQNVMFGLEMERVPKHEAKARALKALEMVQLPQVANRKPNALSGGQQQRVALARALVKNPTVLLLDEPLGALDLKLRKEMQGELKAMQQNLGITFIYVTHDQEEALTMADRIAVMDKGLVLQVGTPKDIYDTPHTRFVADFIGETNFITGVLRDKDSACGHVEIVDGLTIRADLDDPHTPLGKTVTVAVRPEKIALFPKEGKFWRTEDWEMEASEMLQSIQSDMDAVLVPATLKKSIYIGTDTRHVVGLGRDGNVEVVARVQNFAESSESDYQAGQEVYIYWMEKSARILRD
jgi:spermidine/putrescine transport system ATP-binding protein